MERERVEKEATPSSADHEETMRILSMAIRVLVFILFVGWIFVWIMMPTNTYRTKWLPKIREKSSYSTYFGSEGLVLFIILHNFYDSFNF